MYARNYKERMSDMSLKIGLFALQSNIDTTGTAIHIANYIAGDEKLNVALMEPDSVAEELFKTAKADFAEDGTFMANGVHYYPAKTNMVPTESILIYDFREVNILFQFKEHFDKLYVCSDGSAQSLHEIQDYIADERVGQVDKKSWLC